MDKHSADGRKEGNAMKKGGAGKGNWGNQREEGKEEEKEERKERRERREKKEEVVEEVVVEEPEVEVIGLKEYREANKKREVAVVEAKKETKEFDFKTIEKEGLSKMTTRKEMANDDKDNITIGGKKSSKYSALNTGDNKEMLGLSTGFVTKSDKYPQRDRRTDNRQNKKSKKNLNVEDANSFPTL